MQIEISGQHVELTDALRSYINKKIDKLASHLQGITSVHVMLKIEKHLQIAEGQVSFPGNHIHADAESEDMYKTIDLLTDKLVKQLTKHKEKITDHR